MTFCVPLFAVVQIYMTQHTQFQNELCQLKIDMLTKKKNLKIILYELFFMEHLKIDMVLNYLCNFAIILLIF